MLKRIVFVFMLTIFLIGMTSAITFENNYSEDYTSYFYISEIEIPESIQTYQNTDITLHIESVNISHTITIRPNSESLSVFPTSTSRNIEDGDNIITFSIVPGQNKGLHSITFEACSGNQFEGSFCDERQVNVQVIEPRYTFSWDWIILIGLVLLIVITSTLTIKSNKKKK